MLQFIALALFATAPPAVDAGKPALADGEVLVLGETHGSNEIPHYFLEQIRREAGRRPVTVGLEISPSSAALDCRRADPRRLPASWTRAQQDGRSSRAMRALPCALRAPPLARRVRIVFLDDEERGDDFDRQAAARFRHVLAAGGVVGMILTGNFTPGTMPARSRRTCVCSAPGCAPSPHRPLSRRPGCARASRCGAGRSTAP